MLNPPAPPCLDPDQMGLLRVHRVVRGPAVKAAFGMAANPTHGKGNLWHEPSWTGAAAARSALAMAMALPLPPFPVA